MRNMCDPVTDHYLLSREADGSWEELLWFAGCLGNWTYVVCHLIGQKAPPFLRNDCSWRPPQLGEARLIPFLAIPWHCPYELSNSLSFTRRNSILPHALKPVHSTYPVSDESCLDLNILYFLCTPKSPKWSFCWDFLCWVYYSSVPCLPGFSILLSEPGCEFSSGKYYLVTAKLLLFDAEWCSRYSGRATDRTAEDLVSDPGRSSFSPKRPDHLRCHPSSCSLGSGAFTPVVKRSELDVEPSRPSSAEVKNEWISLPPYTFLACTGTSF